MKSTTHIKATRKQLDSERNLSKCQCNECECPIEGLHDGSFFVCMYCKEGKHIQILDHSKQK